MQEGSETPYLTTSTSLSLRPGVKLGVAAVQSLLRGVLPSGWADEQGKTSPAKQVERASDETSRSPLKSSSTETTLYRRRQSEGRKGLVKRD